MKFVSRVLCLQGRWPSKSVVCVRILSWVHWISLYTFILIHSCQVAVFRNAKFVSLPWNSQGINFAVFRVKNKKIEKQNFLWCSSLKYVFLECCISHNNIFIWTCETLTFYQGIYITLLDGHLIFNDG